MQKFAECLTDYMNRNYISYKKASNAISMDRAQLKRYVTGERLPRDKDSVRAIAQGIGMSEEEEENLVCSYERSRMGEKQYRAYKIIECIFRGEQPDFFDDMSYGEVAKASNRENVDQEKKDILKINNKDDLLQWMHYVCDGAETIQMMLQTEEYDRYVYNFLRNNKECCLEQIIHLNNSLNEDDVSDIDMFEKMYSFMECGRRYKVYCTYNDYNDAATQNYLISNKGMIAFHTFEGDENQITGFYTSKIDIQSYYEGLFTKLLKSSYLYGESDFDVSDIEKRTGKIFEVPVSSVRIGFCNMDVQPGIWIHNQKDFTKEKYIYIVEDTIVRIFCMFIEDFENENKSEDS